MNVKQLIAQLKKMPQHLEVGVGMHDNGEGVVAGWICGVDYYEHEQVFTDEWFNGNHISGHKDGEKCVILHC